MTNLAETSNFDTGVYEVQTTDPVIGGPNGISNAAPQNLANRTRWLYNSIQSILTSLASLAGLNSPALTGTPTTPTPAPGDNSQIISNTSFVNRRSYGMISVNVAAGGTITLTAAQYGYGIIELTGAMTANAVIVVPATGKWIIGNYTTGNFTCTIKGSGLATSLVVPQSTAEQIFTDGTNTLQVVSGPIVLGTAVLNLYLSPTGLDTNSGLNAAQPLKTFAGAATVMGTYYLQNTVVNLNLAAGTYAGYTWSGTQFPSPINIKGAGSATTTIAAVSVTGIGATRNANLNISGLKLTATGTGVDYQGSGICIATAFGGEINIGADINFGSSQNVHMQSQTGGWIGVVGLGPLSGQGYTISGGAEFHMASSVGGVINIADAPITLVGTPAFSEAFISVFGNGYVGYWGNTFTGTATGAKYLATGNGVINLAGAGGPYLPGSSAGTASSGGEVV